MVTRVRPAAPPRLLLVDEIEADRSLASVVLSQAFPDSQVQQVSDGADLFTALKSGTFDLVVTELGVRDASWAFVLDAIRALQPQAPIIVFSGTADRDAQLEVLNGGATTFVVKSTQGYLDLKMAVGKVLGYEVEEQGRSARDDRGPAQARGTARDDGWVEVEPASALDPQPQANDRRQPEIESYIDEDDSAQLPAPMATFVAKAHSVLSGPLRQALAILASVIAVSALISFLVSSATSEVSTQTNAEAGIEPSGVVLGAEVTADETPVEETPAIAAPPSDPQPGIELETEADPPPFQGTLPLTLEIRAVSEVWVLVTLDGKDVLDATLQPGASHIFQGQVVAGLRVGNAAGLQVFWNGEDIGQMGRDGQVRRLYFTPDKVGAGAPPDPATLSRP